ncbi:MAG: acyl-CoA dehydrogenase [Proteobacteria bacterium]|nr:acyl-CoA dehydrogenase [Pseudomonadota bacterium]MCP4916501.1 acyl-CoA dehydrogenase [Pseudomonadota bacterium]
MIVGWMSFLLDPELADLRGRVRHFVDERVIPNERAIVEEDRRDESATLDGLRAEARAAGLWTPHLPKDLGGLGLGFFGMAGLFREMGRSPVGATVFNCDAPDQGNMDLLRTTASPEVREKWLLPLCAAEITSAFCMTEPAPGAGADPTNLRTKAVQDGEHWVIDGHKWYSTGAGRASFLIVMARTSDDRRTGCTMFAVDRHAPGVEYVRDIPCMAEPLLAHREAELKFHGVRVGPESILGSVGEGFALAQRRLVPARLTHCMRWLGWASRILEMCRQYLATRESFGKVLARHQMVQLKLAENAKNIHAGNLMTLHCAQMLHQGQDKPARPYSSMCKDHVANTICKVLDDAIQFHGSLGYSHDLPFAEWYRHARAARIADGPDEVHRMVVARDFMLGRLDLIV